MTCVLITFDTELSPGAHRRGTDLATNLAQSIFGTCSDGTFGIGHQMERLRAYGLKGVFFVDPMPAAVFGIDTIKRVVTPILEGGHDVQLHIHTEWLPFMNSSPVGDRRGTNIGDFSYADQVVLLEQAASLLAQAGAPYPTAFRAGNYGANDDTLRALAQLGIRYDSSFNAAHLGQPCRISLPSSLVEPTIHLGVIEIPISCIADRPGKLRHAQLCALSTWEMRSALSHAVRQKQKYFTIVSHSFELLSRDRRQANRLLVRRFEELCAYISDPANGMRTATYSDVEPIMATSNATLDHLPANLLRTVHRMGEQALSNLRYEHSLGGITRRSIAAAGTSRPPSASPAAWS